MCVFVVVFLFVCFCKCNVYVMLVAIIYFKAVQRCQFNCHQRWREDTRIRDYWPAFNLNNKPFSSVYQSLCQPNQLFTYYHVMFKVYTNVGGMKSDNPLAKAHGFSPSTGRQTMEQLLLIHLFKVSFSCSLAQ